MVEIMQETEVFSITNLDCLAHPSKPISHVCMICDVGLCSRCIVSTMKEHSGHEILEMEDAFEKMKGRIDTVLEKGKKACQLLGADSQAIQEQKAAIESCSTDLASAHASKSFGMFGLLQKLKTLLDTTGNKTENFEVYAEDIPDNNCTNETLQYAVDGLHHGMSAMKSSRGSNTEHSIACQKLTAVTVLVDLLRLDPSHQGLQNTLAHLGKLCYESEACSSRVVQLGGADLLTSCFENSITNEGICRWIIFVYGMLAVYPALHTQLVSPKAVTIMEYSIQNFTQYKQGACQSLSFFLANPGIKWPEECASSDKISALVINTCERLPLNVSVRRSTVSYKPLVLLLSQNVSEAAKYWAIWTLYLNIDQHPDLGCPLLAHDGGVTVLKQQNHAHEYVQKLAKFILQKYENYTS